MSRSDERDLVHRLIREIIRSSRVATDQEVDRIIRYMATAPFSDQLIPVPVELRGQMYFGHRIGARADSLTVHVLARVLSDRQWMVGTTPAEFCADVQAAVLHPSAHLIVYRRRSSYIAAILSENIVSPARRGPRSMPLLFVVYSLERGSIISAYQASDVDQISIPGDALWLR